MEFYSYPNRLVCSVLDEMRKQVRCLEKGKDSEGLYYLIDRIVPSINLLIEEAQTLVNRMESALEDWDDIRRAKKEIKKLEREISKLKSEDE